MFVASQPPSQTPEESGFVVTQRQAWTTVALLTLLTVISFVDRQVLALLVDDLRASLKITDLQFGFLVGPAFIITYGIVLVPLAFLVDRWNRKYLLLLGCAVWTTMTFLSAFAQTYTQLVLFRTGLAFGEALLAPISVSLIGDLFSPARRPLPTAIFVAGGAIGTTSASLFSALAYQSVAMLRVDLPGIGAMEPWRLTFMAVALPAAALGIAFMMLGIEPRQQYSALKSDRKKATPLKAHLVGKGSIYFLACFGTGFAALGAAGVNIWGPAYLIRNFGIDLVNAGYLLGSVSMAGTLSGLLAFPFLVTLRTRYQPRPVATCEIALAGLIVACPGLILVGFASSLAVCLAGVVIALVGLAAASALPTQLIQIFTPSDVKARVTALVLVGMFFISTGIGPVLIPLVATLFEGPAAVGRSFGAVALLTTVIAIAVNLVLRGVLVRADASTLHTDDVPAGVPMAT